MKRLILSLAVSAVCLLIFVYTANAGLINYNRRNKTGTPSGGGAYQARPAAKPATAPVGPAWMTIAPVVKNASERVYDVNRDGKLQPAEVKIFLRGVIEVVQDKGGFTVNSDILREYDKNRDGVISRYEVTDLQRDAQN